MAVQPLAGTDFWPNSGFHLCPRGCSQGWTTLPGTKEDGEAAHRPRLLRPGFYGEKTIGLGPTKSQWWESQVKIHTSPCTSPPSSLVSLCRPSLQATPSPWQPRDSLMGAILLLLLGPQSFWIGLSLAPGIIFSWTGWGWGDGFEMIQAHYIYYVLYFYYDIISRSSGVTSRRLWMPVLEPPVAQSPLQFHEGGHIYSSIIQTKKSEFREIKSLPPTHLAVGHGVEI